MHASADFICVQLLHDPHIGCGCHLNDDNDDDDGVDDNKDSALNKTLQDKLQDHFGTLLFMYKKLRETGVSH